MTARQPIFRNPDEQREIRSFMLFGAIGAGAKGFMRGSARVGNFVAQPRCIGSVDVDAAANRDFKRLVGVDATTLDMFSLDQYIAFHGRMPPAGWREATPDDIRRAAGYEFPHIVFLSAPCKGFSGLLNETRSKTDKYQALNGLTERGVFLMLEAFAENLPELIVFENVPRIATRGRFLLDRIVALLRAYGYAVAETTHDCGELGGLAQSRKRFLLVARHMAKVPPFLYEPPKKRLQAVGTVLERMPLPGDAAGGPMHRVPNLQWKTWVRLAFVEAGQDWRSLNRLAVEDGMLRDYLIVPDTSNAVIGASHAGDVAYAVADPRGANDPATLHGKYKVERWDEFSRTVIAGNANGAYAVADPRPAGIPQAGDHYQTGGHYGVRRWEDTSWAVASAACHDNGYWSVADHRMPAGTDKLVAVIRSMDGTWHRPFTTLELAALQSIIEPEEYLELDGLNDSDWRERIGNAVPPAAAEAIASTMYQTLLLAWSGETFMLSSAPIWVHPVAVALSVLQGGE